MASNIFSRLSCEPDIDLEKPECDSSCSCNDCEYLKNIEKSIVDSKNICNLRIFGGTSIFFDIDYNLIKNLISLEKIEYEPIFNFLLGCYLASKSDMSFNSNVKLKLNDVEKEVDIILTSDSGVALVETTREHKVCVKEKGNAMENKSHKTKKSTENTEKLEKFLLKCIPVCECVDEKFKSVLVTLTPESRFDQSHLVRFAKSKLDFEHVGVSDEVANYIENPKYFSFERSFEILDYQIKNYHQFYRNLNKLHHPKPN